MGAKPKPRRVHWTYFLESETKHRVVCGACRETAGCLTPGPSRWSAWGELEGDDLGDDVDAGVAVKRIMRLHVSRSPDCFRYTPLRRQGGH